jgi:predicted dehydrogenase
MHAPMLAGGPETELVGVWARRPEAARELAAAHGTEAYDDYAALLAHCEAVAFAVPPDVQATMATEAARAGKALLLDKPIGLTLAEAVALTEAVDAAGVVSQLTLSNRYRPRVREFLTHAAAFDTFGAQARQLTGAVIAGDYAHGWRLEHGALHDIGPHALDLLDAAIGTIEHVTAAGDSRRYLTLTCRHAGGAVSQLALSGVVPRTGDGRYETFELFGPTGSLSLDFAELSADTADDAERWATLRREFAAAVRAGRSTDLDVHRGLHLQRLIDQAQRSLT